MHLVALLVLVWQQILAAIGKPITGKSNVNAQVVVGGTKDPFRRAVELLVLLASVFFRPQILVRCNDHVDMRVWRPVFDVDGNGGWLVESGVKPARLKDVLRINLGSVVDGIEARELSTK